LQAVAADHSTPAGGGAGDKRTDGVEERAILNTLFRSSGEVVGRMGSLVLFAVAGHVLGRDGLGAFVFAVAFLGVVSVLVDLGLDRYLLRAIAREHAAFDRLFFNVFALKLALAVPFFGVALAVLGLVGSGRHAFFTTLALAPGVLCDSLARTQYSAFMGRERSGPPAMADTIQRIFSAALGIAALEAGLGVVAVAGAYSAGSALGVAIGFLQLPRTIGMPPLRVEPPTWRSLASRSVPFATQDIFSTLLSRADVLIIALIATQIDVGVYGAAYRLFESTVFVTYALAGAYAAMFTYLQSDSEPPLQLAFQRAVKLAVILLTPIAVVYSTLGGPICTLIYGHSFGDASTPLAILGPGVVLLGVGTLGNSLMVSREDPKRMIPVSAAMAALNIALNFALIPPFGPRGAAIAMLATEVAFAIWVLRLARSAAGALRSRAVLAGTVPAAGAMTALALALHSHLALALPASAAVYVVVLVCAERVLNPEDLALLTRLFARRRSANGHPPSSPEQLG
jgi:O-antigen/teichoic acid export membrane protein